MNTVHLIGAEDVAQAGRNMRGAAEEMSRAAANIDGAVGRLIRVMEDAVQRIENVPAKMDEQREREEWEKWALREKVAYRDPQYGLCFYDRGAAGPSWQAWRARADER